MKALIYLLGARTLDSTRDRLRLGPGGPEASLGPLATTDATRLAWRRWSEAGHLSAAAHDHRQQRAAASEQRREPA